MATKTKINKTRVSKSSNNGNGKATNGKARPEAVIGKMKRVGKVGYWTYNGWAMLNLEPDAEGRQCSISLKKAKLAIQEWDSILRFIAGKPIPKAALARVGDWIGPGKFDQNPKGETLNMEPDARFKPWSFGTRIAELVVSRKKEIVAFINANK